MKPLRPLSMRIILLLLLSFSPLVALAQEAATLVGTVRDLQGQPVENISVTLKGTARGTVTDERGDYALQVPAGREVTLLFSYLTRVKEFTLGPLEPGVQERLDVTFNREIELKGAEVVEEGERSRTMMQRLDPKVITNIPTPSGNVEGVLKTLPGVSSNNELSSQYSVRGGNYDENLVYINGIEIYRPFLVRSGQQEGLSVINSDLVEGIRFSAGGFAAEYGDKLSSVLDITYREPEEFHGSVSASLLGGSAHLEGASKDHRLTWLAGARYRSTQYLLGSLETEGEYQPSFADAQAYVTYDVSPNLELGWLGYYGRNKYLLVPESRESTWGTPNLVLRLNLFFEGQEVLEYESLLNALTANWRISPRTTLNFSASAYQTREEEDFDIIGAYYLSQLETDPGSENFGGVKADLGVGAYLDHARNQLFARIWNFQHRGASDLGGSTLEWGVKLQHENIEDQLKEYLYMDSADYSVPLSRGPDLQVDELLVTDINLQSYRATSFLQNTFAISEANGAFLTAGIRGSYWTYNEEFLLSPRVQFVWEPNRAWNTRILKQGLPRDSMRKNWQFKAAAGFYHQPPFYREVRDLSGVLNPGVLAQKSFHAVVGGELIFHLWGRPFKWNTELYYKYLWDLIPYEIEDVRIRYLADNMGVGYAVGADFQIYGEFIKELPSWFSFSLMQTKERLEDRYYTDEPDTFTNPGYIPRPTDQRFMFAILFQDFLPKNPRFKVHLNLVYGSRLPYSPPQLPRFRNQLRMPPYRRVDLGFSYLVLAPERQPSRSKFLNSLDRVWLTAELYNALGIRNTVSYLWVKDIYNQQWSVPNSLTGRRINIRALIEF